MLWQFLRKLTFALIILVTIGIITQTNLSITQDTKEYLRFVLTTDFKLQSFIKPAQNMVRKLKEFDFSVVANNYTGLQLGGELYEDR